MPAQPLFISPAVILGAANFAPEAVALLIVTPEIPWSSACAALACAAAADKIGLFIEAPPVSMSIGFGVYAASRSRLLVYWLYGLYLGNGIQGLCSFR